MLAGGAAPGHPEQPAVHLHGDKHGSHRLRPEPPPGPDGRRDRGSTEAEPVDRTSTKALSTDGQCQSWARVNESNTREQQVPCDVTLTEYKHSTVQIG